jgi:hypothetical protein
LGNKIDKAFRAIQGDKSVGIPVGPDLSFLVSEIVLSRIDSGLGKSAIRSRAVRWFDDYWLGYPSLEDAERGLALLEAELRKFRLTCSGAKSRIVKLPVDLEPVWKSVLNPLRVRATVASLGQLFDIAFRLRAENGEVILIYAITKLFDHRKFRFMIDLIVDLVCQSVLIEPGCIVKVVALLVHYDINGVKLDKGVIRSAIEVLVERNFRTGVGGDVVWALVLAQALKIELDKQVGRKISKIDDDCVAILSMHLAELKLLHGWSATLWQKRIRPDVLNGEHWLAIYEGVRHGWLTDKRSIIKNDALFGPLLAAQIGFYDKDAPSHLVVTHVGGAPPDLRREIVDGISTSDSKVGPRHGRSRTEGGATAEIDLILEDIERRVRSVELAVADLRAYTPEDYQQ